MNRIFLVSVFISVFVPGLSLAEAIIRSTTHPGFDRLIIHFSDDQEWSISKDGNRHTLTATGHRDGFNHQDVFERITRSRIRNISSTSSTIDIELGCDCSLVANELASGQVVLDFFGLSDEDRSITLSDAETGASVLSEIMVDSTQSSNNLERDLEGIRREVFEKVAESATLSILDLDSQSRIESRDSISVFGDIQISDRINFRSSIDVAEGEASSETDNTEYATCLDNEYFEIHNWGDEEDFSGTISLAHMELVNEFDEFVSSSVVRLIRSYLYFAMPTEAKSLLSSASIPKTDQRVLNSLVEIFNKEIAAEGSIFEEFRHCKGSITPWLLLFDPETAVLSEEHRSVLVFEIARWPDAALMHLGPDLEAILQNRGYDTTASVVRQLLPQTSSLIRAERELVSLPISDLYALAKAGDEFSPAALGVYIDRAIDQSVPISTQDIELLSAFIFEHQGLPIARELSRKKLTALAYVGDSDQLMQELKNTKFQSDILDSSIINKVSRLSLESKNEMQALILYNFLARHDLINDLSLSLQKGFFSLLVNNGLSNDANSLIRRSFQNEEAEGFLVDLALMERNMDRLSSVNFERIDSSRQNALMEYLLNNQIQEDFLVEELNGLNQAVKNRFAFASSDWPSVTENGIEREFAQGILSSSSIEIGERPLTTANEMVNSSQSARNLIEDILIE